VVNIFKLTLGVVLIAVLVVFGAQNTQSVSFHFVTWETSTVPVVLALAIAVLVGVLLSWIVSVPGRFSGMRQRRSLQHEIDVHAQNSAAAAPEAPIEPSRGHSEPRA